LKKQGFKAGNRTPFFEDNHEGFFGRETEILAIRSGSDDVEDRLIRENWRIYKKNP